VADAHDGFVVLAPHAHLDASPSWGELLRVAENVAERLGEALPISIDPEIPHVGSALQANPAALETRAMVLQGSAEEISELEGLCLNLKLSLPDSGDVQQVVDETRQERDPALDGHMRLLCQRTTRFRPGPSG